MDFPLQMERKKQKLQFVVVFRRMYVSRPRGSIQYLDLGHAMEDVYSKLMSLLVCPERAIGGLVKWDFRTSGTDNYGACFSRSIYVLLYCAGRKGLTFEQITMIFYEHMINHLAKGITLR